MTKTLAYFGPSGDYHGEADGPPDFRHLRHLNLQDGDPDPIMRESDFGEWVFEDADGNLLGSCEPAGYFDEVEEG